MHCKHCEIQELGLSDRSSSLRRETNVNEFIDERNMKVMPDLILYLDHGDLGLDFAKP